MAPFGGGRSIDFSTRFGLPANPPLATSTIIISTTIITATATANYYFDCYFQYSCSPGKGIRKQPTVFQSPMRIPIWADRSDSWAGTLRNGKTHSPFNHFGSSSFVDGWSKSRMGTLRADTSSYRPGVFSSRDYCGSRKVKTV